MRACGQSNKSRTFGWVLAERTKNSTDQGIVAERSQGRPREDEAEVGAFHTTDEAGEPPSAGSLWRKGKAISSQPQEGNMQETQSSDDMSTSLLRLATLGRTHPQRCFTNLNQYLTQDLLEVAYYQTRQDGATGIDGQTAQDYGQHLQANLASLLRRAKDGSYRAPPVKRAYLRKPDGKQRPIGIPTFEDKVLQRAIVLILEKLYEPIFHPHSYGYRPYRSAHQALDKLRECLFQVGGGYVIELDIQSFFDAMDKSSLRGFLQQRIGDGAILRLINKWLKAGVMEAGQLHYPETGTPQGGVISPMLANIYLHYVLDEWFETQVVPRLINKATLIRFADDGVILLRSSKDMEKVNAVLPQRFARYGLTLHPEKTRQTVFKPGQKSSIDFLGFTHYWRPASRKCWGIHRKTMKSRFARSLKSLKHWCRENRHRPVREQYTKLCQKIRGHYAYFGIRGNYAALRRYAYAATRLWLKWLKRRSQRQRFTRENIQRFFACYPIPTPRIKPTQPVSVMR
jgi:RNA-directed DNA polymerase